MLTVLGKGDRIPDGNTSVQLWKLRCDCGNIIQRRRQGFDRKQSRNPSCGCEKRQRWIDLSLSRSKPDCTGQKFGFLTVVSKAELIQVNGQSRRLWLLQCDCGNTIKLERGNFDRFPGGQRSCGCQKHIGGRKPLDITGKRFGSLVALRLTGKKYQGKPTWLMQCDCGGTSERSLSSLDQGWKLNCGAAVHLPGSWYPPTPNPYPAEAGVIVAKYLYLTRLHYSRIDQAVEDEKLDSLIRSAWILCYRRSKGEHFSEDGERRYLSKCLRYSSLRVYWRRRIEAHGGLAYTSDGAKKEIGSKMTDATSQNDPVNETQGDKCMPMRRTKRIKFKRC